MANLIRSVKPGSDWTDNELRAYNIEVVPESVATFFGNSNLPPPTISPAILAHETYPAAGLPHLPDDVRNFFDLLEAVMTPSEWWSAVVDFSIHLLRLLGYNKQNRIIRRRTIIPLYMCSANTHTKTDVCVVDCTTERSLLLLQMDMQYPDGKDREPQLIAMAIAAFQFHNHRLSTLGLPTVNTAVIPGIMMVGTAPTFYKINVDTSLVEAVELGEYPTQTTIVHKLTPPVQVPEDFQQDGMQPLNNRAVILSRFEAIKQFL